MSGAVLIRQLVIMVVLLLLSAFFSGSETAFFSLNSLEKDLLRRRTTGGRGRFVQLLFSHPDEVLVTILTGNMFVNIFATSISEALGDHFFKQSAEVVSIAAMTIILLIVGEMTPKNLAIRHSLRFSQLSVSVMRYVHTLSRPIGVPLSKLRRFFLSLYPGSRSSHDESRSSAVLSAIRMGYQNKTIEHSELVLLERFFRFRDRTAADVMVPRIDASPVDIKSTVPALLERIARQEFGSALGLIPLARDDVDHIVGYIRRSDLIPFRFGGDEETPLTALARPVHAVPATKQLRELLDEMGELGTEIAVVIDEYGGTEGLVSFSSIIDYLFNEFLPEQERFIDQIDENVFRISGGTECDEVSEVLGIDLEGSSRTIAGLVIDRLGELPRNGIEVEISGYVFKVTEIEKRRIVTLRAERLAV